MYYCKAKCAASADADVAAEQYRLEIERLKEEAAQVGFCFGADAFRKGVYNTKKLSLLLDSPPLHHQVPQLREKLAEVEASPSVRW